MGGNSQKVQVIFTSPPGPRVDPEESDNRMFSEPSRGCRIATRLRLRSGVPALVEDFHGNALVQLPAGRTENRAEGFGYAPIVADHPTDVPDELAVRG